MIIGDLKTMAHLLKYDSNYGHFDGTVEVQGDDLLIDGKVDQSLSRKPIRPISPGATWASIS